ncbi:hypothetical protein [Herbiconiux sp. YIM B11900]|uniref:hypothetical protein n=1 Tax=Herbiconiux sp. YIM B11900 TaxID=3404131 RepID=UPI003F83F3B2
MLMLDSPSSEPSFTGGDDYPGKVLGLVGVITAVLLGVIGLAISIAAYVISRRAGRRNTLAIIGMAIGAFTVAAWVTAYTVMNIVW